MPAIRAPLTLYCPAACSRTGCASFQSSDWNRAALMPFSTLRCETVNLSSADGNAATTSRRKATRETAAAAAE